MSAHEPKPKPSEPKDPTQSKREERAPARPEEPIDFSKLDLTIEKVEERISPGETNVFDK
jgi:hypothetical protein